MYQVQKRVNQVLTRLSDIILSLIFLTGTTPFVLVFAGILQYLYGVPVIFKQQRLGLDGDTFTCYKLRTMGYSVALGKDVALGLYAKVLRCLKIDEQPQLWNVLKGDMSLVGPRPVERKDAVSLDLGTKRLEVRPGLSSPLMIGLPITDEKLVDLAGHILAYLLYLSVIVLTPIAIVIGKARHSLTDRKAAVRDSSTQ